MEGMEWKRTVAAFVEEQVARRAERDPSRAFWRRPLVGFADAGAPFVQSLPRRIAAEHALPRDFLPDPAVVICYFLPFTRELAGTNAVPGDPFASPEWAEAYRVTNALIAELNAALAAHIETLGYRAAVPDNVRVLPGRLVSTWSQRHLAYAAGLGTFGLNNMLITRQGCCGRFGSIVSDLPVPPDRPIDGEYCLYKAKGRCGVCVKNCVSGALRTDGFDREKCRAACMANLERYGVDVCGKCDTGIPCAFTAPNQTTNRRN